MAELIGGRWACNDNEAIQKRAHSGGEEDEVEACKILRWKDEVSKSRAGWVMIKLTWLDHVEPVICRSRDHDITKLPQLLNIEILFHYHQVIANFLVNMICRSFKKSCFTISYYIE